MLRPKGATSTPFLLLWLASLCYKTQELLRRTNEINWNRQFSKHEYKKKCTTKTEKILYTNTVEK